MAQKPAPKRSKTAAPQSVADLYGMPGKRMSPKRAAAKPTPRGGSQPPAGAGGSGGLAPLARPWMPA